MENVLGKTNKYRITWIDIAKGLLMLLIVLCHTLRYGMLDVIVSSFEVPCYFILAGITFKHKTIKTSLINTFKRIMIPYYIFGLISIIIYCTIGNQVSSALSVENTNTSLLLNIYGLLYANCKTGLMQWNTPMFYLPAFFITIFITNLFENAIKNLENKNICRYIYVLIGLIISSYFSSNSSICLPFLSEASLFFSSFIEIGIITKDFFLKKYDKKLLFIVCIFLSIIGPIISMSNYPYGMQIFVIGKNYILYCFNALLMSINMIFISKIIDHSKALSVVGNNTIGILCLHKFPVLFLVAYIPYVNSIMISNNETILMDLIGIVITIISVVLCLIVIYVIMLLCPYLFGVNKKKNIFKNEN